MEYKNGEPCKHRGCLNHITHPCEGCGRVGGITPPKSVPPVERVVNCKSGIVMQFPEHKAGLTLHHNDHKSVYDTAEDWIAENDWCDWEDDAAKQRAIDTDSIWTLRWYPNTPVGFNAVAAPTLEELFAVANSDS